MLRLGLAQPNLIKGCSNQEIQKLQKDFNVIFPKSYIVYLENFGHSLGGGLMGEVDVLYDKVGCLTKELRDEVIIEEEGLSIPKSAFVVAARYGEQFMFFDANGLLEEPPILYYMDGDKDFTKVYDSIFGLLEETLESIKKRI